MTLLQILLAYLAGTTILGIVVGKWFDRRGRINSARVRTETSSKQAPDPIETLVAGD